MRPTISWSDIADSKVGLWGLGTEGSACLRKLRSMRTEPTLVDDRPPSTLGETVHATAAGGLEALLDCDVVIKTPGISHRRPEVETLKDAGIPIVGGLGLWLQESDLDRVLCVTGTKGKSTTTAIAGHLARGLGLRVFTGGNLGAPPYEPDAPTDIDLWVIEVSSYQASDVSSSPPVVAVTSLSPDHLPWHGGVEAYYRDKLSLCQQPGAELTVAPAASDLLVERRSSLGPQVLWITADTWGSRWSEPLGLLGPHNALNAAIARSCLQSMGVSSASDDAAARSAAQGFTPLESRLQLIASVDGVDFIDDSLSTNVLPTLAAVRTFENRRIALIVGGEDREIDYEPLGKALSDRLDPTLVLTTYSTGPAIQAEIDLHRSELLQARPCADLGEAVREGWAWARPDGVVLLSPAAASFDAFVDYRDKGGAFKEAANDLLGEGT